MLQAARGRALILYVCGWVATGAVITATLLFALPSGDEGADALPPVRQTELRVAAEKAGCELRAGGRQRPGDPPLAGGPAPPAAPRVYDSAPPATSLVGAIRRGIVVISYRPELAQEQRALLRAVHMAVPRGTIVVPNARMSFVIAVTAWRRLLGCRRTGRDTLDALRLFQGRFVGTGPDSPR